ncbi:MAG: site-specific integrase, partial [Dehalococcoidia bacterium]|nr:site-specific integrase [Dehalococcoidia bacterium]
RERNQIADCGNRFQGDHLMRGSIIKRSKGSWTIIINLGRDPATAKRKQQWVTIRGTKKQAETRLAELLNQMDTGGFIKPTKETFGSFLQRYLDDYISTQIRATTLEAYQQRGKHLIDGLGHIPVSELREEHIHKYYREKSKTLSPGTLIKHHNLLRSALSQGVIWRTLTRNVAEAVKPPKVSRKEMRALTGPEVHRMLEACEDTAWHSIFHTLTWTGLRRSELLGLRWKDVDLILASLRVVQSVQRLNTGEFIVQEPKTASGRRTIALSPASCLVLREHREKQEADATLLGRQLAEDDLVFSHPDGSPRDPSTLTLAFRRLTRRIGLDGVRLHDLRHTMASLYLEQGVNPKTVAERLGHASVTITLDLYSHCLPGVQEAAAVQFDTAMEQAKSTSAKVTPELVG